MKFIPILSNAIPKTVQSISSIERKNSLLHACNQKNSKSGIHPKNACPIPSSNYPVISQTPS